MKEVYNKIASELRKTGDSAQVRLSPSCSFCEVNVCAVCV